MSTNPSKESSALSSGQEITWRFVVAWCSFPTGVVVNTVANASNLLNTWTRILSQTEHNQRLLLHPGWKGMTEDLAEQEAEALEKKRAAERKAAEEEQRREELRRRREEEELSRRLTMPTSRRARGTRASRTLGRVATRSAVSGSRLPEPPTGDAQDQHGPEAVRGEQDEGGCPLC
ncbi:hypothetical protein UVI_02016950 [Ustilaginoidea virens]|uniref:DASH complex subunit DUO1 n=1 Tax=Ustilaginoidea virens TaxID=1159556 RepID=A0A1B5L1P3_USTVR|nr:hypothetical protein UVI_02016950 [Ustilaginoidea virens]